MCKLQSVDPGNAAELIADIVLKAEGVFLWVNLVIKSLLNGLQDRNTLSDLQRRVDLSSSRLRDLHARMLKSIDPLYHSESSRIFQIFGGANYIKVLTLSFANYPDTTFAMTHPIQ